MESDLIWWMELNKIDLLKARNDSLLKLSIHFNRQTNVVKFGANETWGHVLGKVKICYALRKLGLDFVTEARFSDGLSRADIFVLGEREVAIEVLESEKEESLYMKKAYYICKVVGIKASEITLNLNVEKLIG